MPRHAHQPFAYRTPPEIASGAAKETPVLIVGAGPVGLAAAIDLALHGVKSVVCDDNDVVSVGSRAICWAKRTLEIFDRLGIGDRMVEKGVTWKLGRVFRGDNELYSFDLLPEAGHKMPAFVNLQQYYVEHYLVERCRDFPDLIDLRWRNRVVSVERKPGHVAAGVATPDGPCRIEAQYLLACDGARSPVRAMLGLDFEGRGFQERFLICDIEMEADFPSERWFWFDPRFHPGRSALLHKQPDNIYRIDLQLGPDADPEEEKKPERVIPRVRAMIGDRPFSVDWTSVYSFQCRRLARFVHDRVIFAGDSAHVVSPFGARGGNGGIQDVDNLCWKLAMVLKGEAPPALLASYDEERIHGADENILNSSRATRFMSPESGMESIFREAVLDLAADHAFARKLVNSGRLSRPCSLAGFALQTESVAGGLAPGSPCPDAPHGDGWLLNRLGGRFTLLDTGGEGVEPCGLPRVTTRDPLALRRYGEGMTYLIRPDQHVAAVFRQPGAAAIAAAHARARSA